MRAAAHLVGRRATRSPGWFCQSRRRRSASAFLRAPPGGARSGAAARPGQGAQAVHTAWLSANGRVAGQVRLRRPAPAAWDGAGSVARWARSLATATSRSATGRPTCRDRRAIRELCKFPSANKYRTLHPQLHSSMHRRFERADRSSPPQPKTLRRWSGRRWKSAAHCTAGRGSLGRRITWSPG